MMHLHIMLYTYWTPMTIVGRGVAFDRVNSTGIFQCLTRFSTSISNLRPCVHFF